MTDDITRDSGAAPLIYILCGSSNEGQEGVQIFIFLVPKSLCQMGWVSGPIRTYLLPARCCLVPLGNGVGWRGLVGL